ncbi:2-thiocytidine tRNA biosynthesis protein, TtcA [Tanacetum coccineum]
MTQFNEISITKRRRHGEDDLNIADDVTQALDRGAALLKVDKLVTGHNADDIAKTIILNILRGDIASSYYYLHSIPSVAVPLKRHNFELILPIWEYDFPVGMQISHKYFMPFVSGHLNNLELALSLAKTLE